jgi:hypothetical protein
LNNSTNSFIDIKANLLISCGTHLQWNRLQINIIRNKEHLINETFRQEEGVPVCIPFVVDDILNGLLLKELYVLAIFQDFGQRNLAITLNVFHKNKVELHFKFFFA